ncbi:MAG: YfbM family protein [Planctomycetota bacterium]
MASRRRADSRFARDRELRRQTSIGRRGRSLLMGMCFVLHSVSDQNIDRILAHPPLIRRLVDRDVSATQDRIHRETAPGLFARLFGRRRQDTADLVLGDGEGEVIDLDKSWDGLNFLLTASDGGSDTSPLGFLGSGGTPAGDIEVGYCPALLRRSGEVREIAAALARVDESTLRDHYDVETMLARDIYPTIWDDDPSEDGALAYCLHHFATLKSFAQRTADQGLGFAHYIC